jgi:hypothetical protein
MCMSSSGDKRMLFILWVILSETRIAIGMETGAAPGMGRGLRPGKCGLVSQMNSVTVRCERGYALHR